VRTLEPIAGMTRSTKPYLSAEDTMYFDRLPRSPARDNFQDVGRGILALRKYGESREVRLHKTFKPWRRTSLGSAGDAAVSDLEFQRELSPEQIREALSLLDSTAGAQGQDLRIGDLSPAEEVNPEPHQSSTTMATQDPPQQRYLDLHPLSERFLLSVRLLRRQQ
jgi:hypothetical protein